MECRWRRANDGWMEIDYAMPQAGVERGKMDGWMDGD